MYNTVYYTTVGAIRNTKLDTITKLKILDSPEKEMWQFAFSEDKQLKLPYENNEWQKHLYKLLLCLMTFSRNLLIQIPNTPFHIGIQNEVHGFTQMSWTC